ncbi:MAG: enoyl-CoA hydratase/isomerase family protein [Phycisphaeraceae bacterium]|nr:enoyl-CoA hydratase/isomerase family protein [Phycisphaeraceae bacterium]MCB9848059.1 enoyl-CoA hydratase/isomerase family protein [Phycisphaeraceae bacterium]
MTDSAMNLCTLETNGPVATITLNRPDARNALSIDLLDALLRRLDELATMPDINAAILAGAGRAFCAGMDLKAVLDEPGAPARLLTRIADATLRLRALPMPTIARVNRAAIGGGCGLMCVCDFAITHDDAKIGYPEVDLGVCPAVVAPWLVRKIGAGAARRVLLQGGTMSGARAHELGLVTALAPAEELDAATDKLAQRIASGGPTALRATKRWLNELDGADLAAQVAKGAAISTEVVTSDEARQCLSRAFAK